MITKAPHRKPVADQIFDRTSLGRSIGVTAATPSDAISKLRAGLPYSTLERLRDRLGLSIEDLAKLSRISDRTLARRKREGRLDMEESERVFRLATVFESAVGLFEGDQAAANRWLKTPRAAFAGHTALDFSQTDLGAREVQDLIERIEYGVVS